ncbi:MAG: hypothetical protein NVSMB57_11320 [Actinomycetota bacterium]
MTHPTDKLKMYHELASWWPLLSAPSEYPQEAAMLAAALREFAQRPVRTVLELGSGGGNNAVYLKESFEMTLSDLSADMLAVSRALNPECEHVQGDMRTVQIGRRFDAVLIYDAIDYMLTADDVAAALRNAVTHLEPGGVLVIVPDDTAESYKPTHDTGGHDDETRSMRYLRWAHPVEGTSYRTTYVYALRESGGEVRVEHEDHVTAAFPQEFWLSAIKDAGLHAISRNETHWGFDTGADRDVFIGVAPGTMPVLNKQSRP